MNGKTFGISPSPADRCHAPVMGHESSTKASGVTARSATAVEASPELKRELLDAVAEIDRGDCVELSPEQLERCIVDGEWPWADESPG